MASTLSLTASYQRIASLLGIGGVEDWQNSKSTVAEHIRNTFASDSRAILASVNWQFATVQTRLQRISQEQIDDAGDNTIFYGFDEYKSVYFRPNNMVRLTRLSYSVLGSAEWITPPPFMLTQLSVQGKVIPVIIGRDWVFGRIGNVQASGEVTEESAIWARYISSTLPEQVDPLFLRWLEYQVALDLVSVLGDNRGSKQSWLYRERDRAEEAARAENASQMDDLDRSKLDHIHSTRYGRGAGGSAGEFWAYRDSFLRSNGFYPR